MFDPKQNQTTAHLNLHLQNQFSTGVTHHTDLSIGSYEQGDTPGPGRDTWRCLGPNRHQLQCSPLGSMSGEVTLGRWSSDFSSSPAEDSSSTQFFHNNTPQPFCSPNTPGPSPHYPQTPTISSPGPHLHPREDRLDLHAQLSRDTTLSCRLQECDGYQMISEQHLLQSQSELIQDQTGLLNAAVNPDSRFSPQGGGQDVSNSTQTSGLPAGLSWREESGGGVGGGGGGRGRGRGGRGRGGGGGGGGGGQPDWNWVCKRKLFKAISSCFLILP